MRTYRVGLLTMVICGGLIGCTTTQPTQTPVTARPVSSRLAKAEVLFQKGEYTGAMI